METIFVQDHDPEVLEVLTIALEMEGFIVYPYKDVHQNLMEQIDEIRPHLVVLDYMLSGKECVDMCHQIKARYPHLPVIAISCNYNIHLNYFKEGFDDYIKKPFDIKLLYEVIANHIPKYDFADASPELVP